MQAGGLALGVEGVRHVQCQDRVLPGVCPCLQNHTVPTRIIIVPHLTGNGAGCSDLADAHDGRGIVIAHSHTHARTRVLVRQQGMVGG